MKKEITQKTQQQHETIIQSIKLDNDRVEKIEVELKQIAEVKKKIHSLNYELGNLTPLKDEMLQLNCFVERILPIQVHHQMCEGLNKVAGSNLSELMEFEKNKTDELHKYIKQCEGRQPSLKPLRQAFEQFHRHMQKNRLGSAPFMFGDARDNWARSRPKEPALNSIQKYATNRSSHVNNKLQKEAKDRTKVIEEMIKDALLNESEKTGQLVQRTVSDIRERLVNLET